ncbi:MAG: PEGA domain-containing protein, partial [Methanomicrobiales archaeon]
MNIARWALALIITLVLPGLLVTGAYAMTVTPGSGQVQPGLTTQIPIVIDHSPADMGYYNITVSVSDPTIARITWVTFPGWANWLPGNSSVPAGSIYFKAVTLSSTSMVPATDNLTLGTLTVEGLKAGMVSINVDRAYFQWSNGGNGNADRQSGALQVGSAAPTTGAISVSSVPTGAMVYLDGVSTGHVTSTTLTGITPGSHTVVVKMSGYDDATQPVTVTAGVTIPVSLTLTPVSQPSTTGAISVSSVPTGAMVYLDGVSTGHV